ncbi:recombination regulator RecX [Staphylococcus hominis]|uniref:recombination regulator RecX n=1 Tax=Staphylococcus hominis TaxID=1290 RepID=UPI0034D5A763
MPKITKIEVQKNNKERFNLFLDEAFEMGIDIDTLVKFNLKKNQMIDAGEMEKIQKYEHYRLGINMAIQYLSYKKRTEKEVSDYLKKNDINEMTVQKVIEYCYKEQYINHEDYAESLKNTMINTTDKGPEVFKQKLYQVGVEPNIIDRYVKRYEEEQPIESIIHVAKKIMKTKKGPVVKVKQKVMHSLIQKGYTIETAQNVLNELDFAQDEEVLDDLLQKDLEKVYNKQRRKHDGNTLKMKTIEALMRKGYNYDKIKIKLAESGILDE